jgi:precorrin-2 dehydrogenase/sirohydrochlorin ferrochelatase
MTNTPLPETARAPLLPLMLDVTDIPIFVVGNGGSIVGRLAFLAEHGAGQVHVFAPEPTPELAVAAKTLQSRWPTPSDFETLRPRLVFVADTPTEAAEEIAALAQSHGALAHVHDDIPLCRFHLPARLRRGRLLVTVSTDGAAAGFSRLLRDYLAATVFGPEWAGRMEEISSARRAWKEKGLSGENLFNAIRKMTFERGWLQAFSPFGRDESK